MSITLTPAQQAVVTHEGSSLLVSAAAGSGKTKVLIDRLLRRVCEEGANIDDFLIITYTNAAAAELRMKISAAISERLSLQPSNRHLQRQLTRVYLTQISTVHAFCAAILRRFAHEADLPADFRIGEEFEMQLLRERVLNDVLEAAYAHLAERPAVAAAIDQLGYGRDDRRLTGLILQLYDAMRCQVDPEAWLAQCTAAYQRVPSAEQTPWGQYWMQRLHEAASDAEDALSEAIAVAARDAVLSEKYVPLFQQNLAALHPFSTLSSWDAVYAARDVDFGRLPVVRKAEDLDAKERAAALRKSAISLLREVLDVFYADSATVCADLAASFSPLAGLLELTRDFSSACQKAKRQRKLLDFSDLEHEAIRLLTDRYTGAPTAAARQIAAEYREILVDEYQDSNAVQETIFQSVSHSGQNLFLVGDVKQSIYRFRLADPALFLQKYNTWPDAATAASGQSCKLRLADNFRSREEILQAANDVFSLVMNRKSCELDYGAAERLRPGRTFPTASPPFVELHAIDLKDETEDEDGPGLEKAREEAAFVAGRIAELLSGGCRVTDGDALRPARPGDIVILMRSPGMTAQHYQQALAAHGIASVSDRGGSLLETTEAELLTAILAILDNPHQDVPLVTALSSPVFAFSPDDLAQLRANCRTGDLYEALCLAPQDDKIAAFLRWLERLRTLAREASLSDLIAEIFNSTGMIDIFASYPDGVQRANNLSALRDLAIRAEQQSYCPLSVFRMQLAQMKERGLTPPSGSAQPREDAVQIMSIHKSKGLEFPIVFLADLSRRFNLQDNTASVLTDSALGLAALVTDLKSRTCWPTIAHMAIADKKTRQAVAEELRVLYVAMTRAKERLVMSNCSAQLASTLKKWNAALTRPLRPSVSGQARRLGDWILLAALCRTEAGELFAVCGENAWSTVSAFPWEIHLHSARGLRGWKAEPRSVPHDAPGLPDAASLMNAMNAEYPYRAATSVPSKLTATQLKGRGLDAEAAEDAPLREGVARTWRKPEFMQTAPLTGREKGNATHLFMQFARYEACCAESSLRAELQRLQAERFLTARQAEAVDLTRILRLFSAPFGNRILSASNLRREFKFSLLTDAGAYFPEADGEEILLQGVVDCFWEDPDGLVILDFKTDRIHGDLEEKAAHYAPQLTAYAAALSRIFQRPVKETWLYFFDADSAVQTG